MSNEFPEFFEELKKIRLKKKLTLKQISQSTRINLKYLESLEEGNLLSIPEIYDKLFFKSYLKALNVEETDYYNLFMAYRKTMRADHTSIVRVPEVKKQFGQNFNLKNILYFLPFVIVILLIWFLISNTLMVGGKNSQKVREISIREVVEQIQSQIDSSLAQRDTVKAIQPQLLTINVVALDRTWFRVVTDEKDTAEYLVNTGENVNLKSEKSFEFLIGKANGIKIISAGKEYGPFGEENQVVRYMRFDSTGIVNKLVGYPISLEDQPDEN